MLERKKSKPSRVLILPKKNREKKYRIVAGLGNPGKEFENTYHNVGVMALSRIAQECEDDEGAAPKRPPCKIFRRKIRKGERLFEYAERNGSILVKPLVFMNESGRAIASAAREFGAKPEDFTIIHDDSDLTLGDFKISFGKNAGGHQGVQSIIDTLRSKNFTRIRIGIRPKTETRRKKAGVFVLAPITKKDKETLSGVFKKIEKITAARSPL
jgi:PTH1 family peptidyl-tRNA hydrolase